MVGPELRDLRVRGMLAQHDLSRVAGDEAEENEGRQGEGEQRERQERQPAEEITDHAGVVRLKASGRLRLKCHPVLEPGRR